MRRENITINMEFELLADSIKKINNKAGNAAKSAVNQLLTLRNWAIGYYIVEYEQGGSDRAEYGTRLLRNLENEISERGMNVTLFKACRQFYLQYPQIGSTVSNQFNLPNFEKSSTASNLFVTDPEQLINNLSFSHIREIMVLEDSFERFFYETECIRASLEAYYDNIEYKSLSPPSFSFFSKALRFLHLASKIQYVVSPSFSFFKIKSGV